MRNTAHTRQVESQKWSISGRAWL